MIAEVADDLPHGSRGAIGYAAVRRRLVNLATIVSLVLFAAAAGLWVYTVPFHRSDFFNRGWGWRILSAQVTGGKLYVWHLRDAAKQPEFALEWRHESERMGSYPAYPPRWSLLGLGWRTRHVNRREPPYAAVADTLVIVPFWQVCLVGGIIPAWRGLFALRRRKRSRPGHCPHCGYDLRATPQKCPECGNAVAAGAGA